MNIDSKNNESEYKTLNFKQVTLSDRWSPLVKGPNENIYQPENRIQRTLICALCLLLGGIILWSLQVL